MCKPKDERAIGFFMIHEFNLALLEKQLCRLVQFTDSLQAKVIRGRYYRWSSPFWSNPCDNPSYGWTSIMTPKPLIALGIRQNVHSGYEIIIWENIWIPMISARPARAIVHVFHPKTTLSDFIPKRWNMEKLGHGVTQEDILWFNPYQ